MSVSGRAGLFTIDPRFTNDLRDDVHTAPKRQKSGALRLEFGKFSLTAMGQTSATVRTTLNTGITTIVTPSRVPNDLPASAGIWIVASPGNYVSGVFDIRVLATGQFSGQTSGIDINYMVVGY